MSYPNNPPVPASITVDTTASINSGLVGFWPLTDGTGTTATDLSTGGNDGTQSGGVTWASTAIGTAASFDGVDDEFTISHSSDYNAATTGALSISAWVLIDTATDYRVIVGKDRGGSGREWLVYYNYLESKFSFSIWSSGGTQFLVSSSSTYPLSTWFHVVQVWDGSTLRGYVDGVEVASLSAAITPKTDATADVKIGDNVDNQMDGNIQNVRIYNRAITATEVAELYSVPWTGTDYVDLVYAYYSAAFLQRL